jgi:hypothetical protein
MRLNNTAHFNFRRSIGASLTALVILLLPVAGSYAQTIPMRLAKVPAEDGDQAIRPFRFTVSQETLTDLKRRLAATRWPERRL